MVLPVALFVAILAVSTASILIRFAQEEASSLTIAALRLTFASAVLAPVALTRYRAQLAAVTRRELVLACISGLFLAVHFATWISSLAYTTVASSVVLVSTGPLWVALLSPAFLGEHVSRPALFGLGLAIVGGSAIAIAPACSWHLGPVCQGFVAVFHGRALWGNFLALAGAWAVSGYLILGRRLRQSMHLIPYIFLVYSLAALILLPVMFATGGTPFGLPSITYVWLVLLALVPQLIGHSTYNWALRFLPASIVAVTTLGEPIGSAVLAYLLLSEVPGAFTLAGGALVLAGIYLAARHSGQVSEPAA